jgi:hypothetical protein
MRIVLRIIAIGIWIALVSTLGMVWRIWHFDHFVSLMARKSFGVLTIIGWGLTLTVGGFAATQLWRLRESGRKSSLVLLGYGVFYYIAGWLLLQQAGTVARPAWFAIGIEVALMLLLLSPAARNVCQSGSAPKQPAAIG